MDYSQLQRAFGNLRYPDDEVLKRAGLGQLAKTYTAYTAVLENARLCILLPHGLEPTDVGRLAEAAAAAKRVVVLKEDGRKWVKLWPGAHPIPAPEVSSAPEAPVEPAAQESGPDIEFVEE